MAKTLLLLGLLLCSCQKNIGSSPTSAGPGTDTRVEGSRTSYANDDWRKTWERLKASAPDTDPPATIGVFLKVSGPDVEASQLVVDLLRKALGTVQHIRIVTDAAEPDWVLDVQVRMIRAPDSGPVYVLSYVALQRLSTSEDYVKCLLGRPNLIPTEYRDDITVASKFDRVAMEMFDYVRQSTDVFVGVIHYTGIADESELRSEIERYVAALGASKLEPAVRAARAKAYLSSQLKTLADGLRRYSEESRRAKE